MCREGGIWKGKYCNFSITWNQLSHHASNQVRVVQHKQTRELYALKYINKTKCVKMKAVPNVIQERRLLEEVSLEQSLEHFRLTICRQLAICLSR
jgi:hypothetical protein